LNGKSEVRYALKNAVEALATTQGTDYERLKIAVSELRVLKKADFGHPIDVTMLEIIKTAEGRIDLDDKASIDVNNVMRNIWTLYDRWAPKSATSPN
jgi:hypothetical protein